MILGTLLLNGCANLPVTNSGCGWINHYLPITVTEKEKNTMALNTLKQIADADHAWKRHCSN